MKDEDAAAFLARMMFILTLLLVSVVEMNGVDKLDKEALVLLSGHEKEVYACSWNPMKNILVSGSSDSTARVWTLPNIVEDRKEAVSMVLNHGTGPHKDVTTLEWNVCAPSLFFP